MTTHNCWAEMLRSTFTEWKALLERRKNKVSPFHICLQRPCSSRSLNPGSLSERLYSSDLPKKPNTF